MAKSSGLGDNFYVGGNDLSGDTNSLSNVSGGPKLIDLTSIKVFAPERVGGLRDGKLDWVSYFNATGAHPVLSSLPTTDVVASYARGTTLGSPAACMTGKQINYDGMRTQAGDLTFKVEALANSYGLEWGTQLTAGLRTDTVATTGTSVDFTASTSFGFQAYLQVIAFVGTDVTIKLQDSADNSSFADIASGAFTQVVAANVAQRIAVGGTATVREFVRATTVTTGGFTSVTFSVVLMKNTIATVVF